MNERKTPSAQSKNSVMPSIANLSDRVLKKRVGVEIGELEEQH